jgi:adenylylsulfate kinase
MRAVANKGSAAEFIMLCDFVCPTRELREIFDADFTVWMDTIPKSKYKDTNAIFECPTEDEYDIRIDEFASDSWSETLADLIHMLLP